MQLLVDKHDLKSPVYVGDTDSDSVESSKAGVPFVYMTYGFGKTDNYSIKFDTFNELVEYYYNLANNHK
jgi:phosphoglycolate phosphatase